MRLLGGLFFCFSQFLVAQEALLRVANPASFDRNLETVEVPWDQLQSAMKVSTLQSFSVFENDAELESQSIDIDGNGIPDQIIFQSAFKGGEEKQFLIKVMASNSEKPILTNAKFILPRKDVAWENDRIAFRIYGGPLAGNVFNGLDVWVKRVRTQIIDKWYDGDSLKGKKRISYHIDHGEGADMFEVGKSLGAGACALWTNDSLNQPGLFTQQRIITTGPIRTMFTVWYEKDSVGGVPFREEATYTLDKGKNLNRIQVQYSGDELESEISIAAGLVKRKDTNPSLSKKEGWLSLWGSINDDSTNGLLGTGIVVPSTSIRKMTEDHSHYLIVASAFSGKPFIYYAGAGWTRSGDFMGVEDWNKCLSQCSKEIKVPLTISIVSAK